MARFNSLQTAFVSGELSPRMEGRDDLRQYGQGMRQSVNQFVLPQGAVMHRPGTQFESETKGSGPVILRPFQVGLDQAYILEMGDEYMRFHANEGQLAIATAVNAVNLDGSTYASSSGLSGASDSGFMLTSLWFNVLGADDQTMVMVSVGGVYQVARTSNNRLEVYNATDGTNLLMSSSALFTASVNPGWHHLLATADASIGRKQVYIDDVAQAVTADTPGVNLWDTDPEVGVGTVGVSPGALKFTGDLAEVYLNIEESLDLSDINNRRKFIDAAGKPVALGANGDFPTGNPPALYLSGPTASWHTNDGTGGGLTETGTLTTASTSPSD